MCKQASFHTKSGLNLPGISLASYQELWHELLSGYGLHSAQCIEAASYSMAMVVRYALGLSAAGGQVCCLAADTPAGWTALATLRHLTNAGAKGIVIAAWDTQRLSIELELALKPLHMNGVPCRELAGLAKDSACELFASCHNVICGLFERSPESPGSFDQLIETLNELQTPVHTIEAPLGVNADSGAALSCPLYASSTLSLGAPLQGLHSGHTFVGRHYLCDISIPPLLYRKYTENLGPLFAEQPVLQIFPSEEEGGEIGNP